MLRKQTNKQTNKQTKPPLLEFTHAKKYLSVKKFFKPTQEHLLEEANLYRFSFPNVTSG